MSSYHFNEIETYWQKYWKENNIFKVDINTTKPKYYVLDMFPYPSGAGLHVGHPLGYIASDIVARYKRHNGFNVLHPMGYDAFGLPAEQYAIQTGQHPAVTTQENIKRYREQLDKIGFSFDWSREIKTCEPQYYKWTQWIFIQLFNSWYNPTTQKAENINTLIASFNSDGYQSEELNFTAEEWNNFDENKKSEILLQFRLAYLSEAMVNWCPALGTVLANDEVKDGLSERGGYPVERKLMKQWSLRMSVYAERLLQGLETLNWSESIKEAQRNWIGKSKGCSLLFDIENTTEKIEVFTTRPDTVFGVSFIVLAPEHPFVQSITTKEQANAVNSYTTAAINRTERERMADVKNISGVFTGAYAIHPFTNEKLPIWVGDYVLAGYGTGAVMAVAAHDSRDYAFAKYFNLPIKQVVSGGSIENEAYETKEGILINSDFLDGLNVADATIKVISEIENRNLGKGKVNYRLRDAIFGRQRYWGEPIPIYYKDDIPCTLPENSLPLVLPEIDTYLPTSDGEPPLARAAQWTYNNYPLETTTMPGWAGSSWYFLRYMDSQNSSSFASKETLNYWQQIDLYVGGSEHATGHLLYFRFWTKFLYDLGLIPFDEPAKKLINQGMIQGTSCLVYRINGSNQFVSYGLKEQYETTPLHIDVNLVNNQVVDIDNLKKWRPSEFENATFILENNQLIAGSEVGKMSKRWHNVVNPDDICKTYGADTLRMYEMFLGPLEDAKPWNTQGIEGVLRFLRKLWRLFHNNTDETFYVSNDEPSKDELKILHRTIKKITEDIEQYSFNTSISAFMVCVNELQELKCNKHSVLKELLILLAPFAPHICEELWSNCGNTNSITYAEWPKYDENFLVETEFNYPVSFNGKVKFNIMLSLQLDNAATEKAVLSNEKTIQLLEGRIPKKIIVVKGKIVNLVV